MDMKNVLFVALGFANVAAAATDLSTLCSGSTCTISSTQSDAVTIDKDLSSLTINADMSSSSSTLQTKDLGNGTAQAPQYLTTFTNNATISTTSTLVSQAALEFGALQMDYFYNYGTISGGSVNGVYFTRGQTKDGTWAVVVQDFYNYGTISTTGSSTYALVLEYGSKINNLYNYGTISGGINVKGNDASSSINALYNYGTILPSNSSSNKYHIVVSDGSSSNTATVTIAAWAMQITEDASTFNSYTTASSDMTSHISININNNGANNAYLTNDAQLILEFSDNFELNTNYSLSKLIVLSTGSSITYSDGSVANLGSHLISASSIYTISSDGTNFSVSENLKNSVGSSAYKSGFQSMNNLALQAKSRIFAPKRANYMTSNASNSSADSNNTNGAGSSKIQNKDEDENSPKNTQQRTRRGGIKKLSAEDEAGIFYLNYVDNGVPFFRALNRENANYENINHEYLAANLESSASRDSIKDVRSSGIAQNASKGANSEDFYFFFTPFVSHTMFNESSGADLSGLSYGFVSGFNGMLGESNTLGVHLGFSYGGLESGTNTSLDITTLNIMLGLHYKLDFAYGMYIKAFGEFYYLMNDVNYVQAYSSVQKPDGIGFDASLYFGKDFDFDAGGILGLEIGAGYQGLQLDEMTFTQVSTTETYYSSLSSIAYADLGLNYTKAWESGFGLNAALGVKYQFLAPSATFSLTNRYTNAQYDISTDTFIAYAGLGASYYINKNIELNLSYLGAFGDTQMTNSGFFSVRVMW